jgi:purine catabolism regulator
MLMATTATMEVADFVERTLGPLLRHDARHRGALLPTLEAYLDAAGNKRAAAVALGVQRQTLYSRLARLDDLLEVDLSDPRTRTSLHVAVLAWRLRTGAAGFRGRER